MSSRLFSIPIVVQAGKDMTYLVVILAGFARTRTSELFSTPIVVQAGKDMTYLVVILAGFARTELVSSNGVVLHSL